jgi:hypothetical protein
LEWAKRDRLAAAAVSPGSNPTTKPSATSDLSAGRMLALGRAVQATIVLVRPPSEARAIARVLAVRELGQAALTWAGPTPTALRLGAGVDVLHASSMVLAAWLWPRQRRSALISLGLASGWAVAAALIAAGADDEDDEDDADLPDTGDDE